MLSDGVSPGSRGPERRANRFSFFEEITAEQMSSYSPAQIATILKQKETVSRLLAGIAALELTGLVVARSLAAAPEFRQQSAASILSVWKPSRPPVEAASWVWLRDRLEALGTS